MLLLSVPLAASAAAPEPAAIVERLARPAPASIAFAEVRFSPLLRQPLIVSGELSYSGPTSLDRRVSEPYREKTTIRGESVRVEREGESARSFGLKRAPELRGLLTGFAALLAGDAAALERSFDVTVDSSARGDDEGWMLHMKPRDARAGRRLRQIDVTGRGNTPRCFTLLTGDGGASVMVLGEVLGDVSAKLREPGTLEGLEELCGAGLGAWDSEGRPAKERTPVSHSGPSPTPPAPRSRQ